MRKKKIKKICLLRSLKVVFLLGCIFSIYRVLDYVVTDDIAYMTRITFHDFYEMDKIDTVFLGASHTFQGINVEQLTEELGKEVFTVSTSLQDMISSYYLIKEVVGKYAPSEIYLEVSPAIMNVDREPAATSTYIISDYLYNPLLKVQYLLEEFGDKELVSAFFRVKRNLNVLNLDSSIWDISSRKNQSYKNYQTDDYSSQYLGRGSWSQEGKLSDALLVYTASANFDNVGVSEINQKSVEYLQKIVELCQTNGIRLTLYAMPYSEIYLQYNENYMEFMHYFQDFAKENDLGWFDLNLVKSEYLLLSNADFRDLDHLNFDGNEKATNFLVTYLSNPKPDYFWDSLEQKELEEQIEPHIIALEYEVMYCSAEGEKLELLEQESDYLKYEVAAIESGISDFSYEVYYCYGEDENKSIKGESILYEYGEQGSICFTVPYESRDTAFAIEIFDVATGKSIYRVIKGE